MYGRRVILFIIIFTLTLLPNITVAQVSSGTNSIQPTFTLYSSNTIRINASSGGIVSVTSPDGTKLTTKINQGTYANLGGTILSSFNFTLATFTIKNVASIGANIIPQYAFAFEINGQITPLMTLVNASGGGAQLTIANHPSNWTTLAFVGGTFNGTSYSGGNYLINVYTNTWFHNATPGIITNTRFTEPLMRVFVIAKGIPLLTLYSSKTIKVNASSGGTLSVTAPDGTQITTKINPGTYVNMVNTVLSSYNFTLATFTLKNIMPPQANMTPEYGMAFEINGQISPLITFLNSTGGSAPLTTIANHDINWTTLTFSSGIFNGTAYLGGVYAYNQYNLWRYNTTSRTMTNTRYISPTVHIFLYSTKSLLASSTGASSSIGGFSFSLTNSNSSIIFITVIVILIVIILVLLLRRKTSSTL